MRRTTSSKLLAYLLAVAFLVTALIPMPALAEPVAENEDVVVAEPAEAVEPTEVAETEEVEEAKPEVLQNRSSILTPADFLYKDKDPRDTETTTKVLAGLTDEGIAKLKALPAEQRVLQLPEVDDQGNPIGAIGSHAFFNLKAKLQDENIEKIIIPDNYTHVAKEDLVNEHTQKVEFVTGKAVFGLTGAKSIVLSKNMKHIPVSFASRNNIESVIIPDGVDIIDFAAFYDNNLTEITIPASVKEIKDAAFRQNKIAKINFAEDMQLKEIHRWAFANNNLTTITLPDIFSADSKKKSIIGAEAFGANKGEKEYGGLVVLLIKNPGNVIIHDNTVLVNPTEEDKIDEEIDYTTWTAKDFAYEDYKNGATITGFSKIGKYKIKQNKTLVLPEKSPDGKTILAIRGSHWGLDSKGERVNIPGAFRNGRNGYDIQSVEMPDTIEDIGAHAFLGNDIAGTLKLPKNLKNIGTTAFGSNKITDVIWPDALETIGHVAFFNNKLTNVAIPNTVTSIGQAAFRKNGMQNLTFGNNSQLAAIEKLAFADNKLTTVQIPGSLKKIGHEAFAKNPGEPKYDNKVVLLTPNQSNPQKLTDDVVYKTYVVDPDVAATDADLQRVLEKAKKVHAIFKEGATPHDAGYFAILKNTNGVMSDLEKSDNPSRAHVLGAEVEADFVIKRAELSRLTKQEEITDKAPYDDAVKSLLRRIGEESRFALRNIDASDETLNALQNGLKEALATKGDVELYQGFSDKTTNQPYFEDYQTRILVVVKDGKVVGLLDNGSNMPFDADEETEQKSRPYFENALRDISGYLAGQDANGKTLEFYNHTAASATSAAIEEATRKALDSEALGELILVDQEIVSNETDSKGKPVYAFTGQVKMLFDKNGKLVNVTDERTDTGKNEDILPIWIDTVYKTSDALKGKSKNSIRRVKSPEAVGVQTDDVSKQPADELLDMIQNALGGKKKPSSGGSSGGIVPPTPGDTDKPDTDKPDENQPSDDVLFPGLVNNQGYIGGYKDGTFGPRRGITRAEVAEILYRASGAHTTALPDANDAKDHWAKHAIAWANENGIMNGYKDGSFKPNKVITRAEIAATLSRDNRFKGKSIDNPFTDTTQHWAKAGINKAASLGWMVGVKDNLFKPNDTLTRAQAVCVFNRYFNIEVNKPVGATPFVDISPTHWAYADIVAASKK